MAAAATPVMLTSSEMRPPNSTRVSTSRPKECARDGGASRLKKSMSVAEYGLSAAPITTAMRMVAVIASPVAAVRLRMMERTSPARMSARPARVERAAREIDRQVDGEHDDEKDDRAGLHHWVVAGEAGIDHQGADPRHAEDALDDDDAAENVADLQPDDREVRDEGVAERPVDEDEDRTKPEGARRRHMVLMRDAEQRRAQGAGEERRHRRRHGDRRQQPGVKSAGQRIHRRGE